MHQPGEHGQVVRCLGDRVTIEAQEIRRGIDRVRDQTAGDHTEWVQTVGE